MKGTVCFRGPAIGKGNKENGDPRGIKSIKDDMYMVIEERATDVGDNGSHFCESWVVAGCKGVREAANEQRVGGWM